MKSNDTEAPAASFYVISGTAADGVESFSSTPATAGPWNPKAQHGGPPAALLGRAVEGLLSPGRVVGRITMDLLGPVPVGPLSVGARVLRPGRNVELLEAELVAEGRTVARAQAWAFPELPGPGTQTPLDHLPSEGVHEDPPTSWHRGYLDSVEWRWHDGAVTRPGKAEVWMRPRIPLVEGEEMTGLQRLLCCVDSASGVSAALDVREWNFLNTELTVHVLRPPEGEWVCLQASTDIGSGSVGLATSAVFDQVGLIGRSAQALLVAPAHP